MADRSVTHVTARIYLKNQFLAAPYLQSSIEAKAALAFHGARRRRRRLNGRTKTMVTLVAMFSLAAMAAGILSMALSES
ncbi:MAG: hypothetical protein AB7O04_09595 [Hyphomonadaceae bacterium]